MTKCLCKQQDAASCVGKIPQSQVENQKLLLGLQLFDVTNAHQHRSKCTKTSNIHTEHGFDCKVQRLLLLHARRQR